MRTITFNTMEFELASKPNILADRFQATIIKGQASMEDILSEADNVTTVTIKEDGVVTSVYKGYNHLFALNLIMAPNTQIESQKVSIELQNTSMQNQINQLHTMITRLQSQTSSQHNEISNLNDQITEISGLQSSALEDIGAELSAIAETQETQSKAIEDLGSTLSDMVNPESEEIE